MITAYFRYSKRPVANQRRLHESRVFLFLFFVCYLPLVFSKQYLLLSRLQRLLDRLLQNLVHNAYLLESGKIWNSEIPIMKFKNESGSVQCYCNWHQVHRVELWFLKLLNILLYWSVSGSFYHGLLWANYTTFKKTTNRNNSKYQNVELTVICHVCDQKWYALAPYVLQKYFAHRSHMSVLRMYRSDRHPRVASSSLKILKMSKNSLF